MNELLPDLAFAAATAYANSPTSNKNDPKAFAEAVRNVYESVLAVKVANNPLLSPYDLHLKMVANLKEQLLNEPYAPYQVNWRPGCEGKWYKSVDGGPYKLQPGFGEKS